MNLFKEKLLFIISQYGTVSDFGQANKISPTTIRLYLRGTARATTGLKNIVEKEFSTRAEALLIKILTENCETRVHNYDEDLGSNADLATRKTRYQQQMSSFLGSDY